VPRRPQASAALRASHTMQRGARRGTMMRQDTPLADPASRA